MVDSAYRSRRTHDRPEVMSDSTPESVPITRPNYGYSRDPSARSCEAIGHPADDIAGNRALSEKVCPDREKERRQRRQAILVPAAPQKYIHLAIWFVLNLGFARGFVKRTVSIVLTSERNGIGTHNPCQSTVVRAEPWRSPAS